MEILNGKELAKIKSSDIIARINHLGFTPTLVIILIGNNFASKIYVNHKIKKAKTLGVNAELLNLDDNITQEELIKKLKIINNDRKINGYLVQLPLPKHIDPKVIQKYIDHKKDVDGLSTKNAGMLFQGSKDYIIPATPRGIISILKHYNIKLEGKIVAVIGRSNIVGKPISLELLKLNATVIMCHSKTDLKILKTADIIVSSTGIANLIKKDMIKDKCIIIDVGINRDINNKLTGDVDFESVKDKVSWITPVPGGVGPMTIISIFENLLELIEKY